MHRTVGQEEHRTVAEEELRIAEEGGLRKERVGRGRESHSMNRILREWERVHRKIVEEEGGLHNLRVLGLGTRRMYYLGMRSKGWTTSCCFRFGLFLGFFHLFLLVLLLLLVLVAFDERVKLLGHFLEERHGCCLLAGLGGKDVAELPCLPRFCFESKIEIGIGTKSRK